MHSVRAATELERVEWELPSGEGLVRRQEARTHQMTLSPQRHSLGVVVAILSVDVKLLALKKDQKNKNKQTKTNDFREILI